MISEPPGRRFRRVRPSGTPETHANSTGHGTKAFEGPAAPTQGQSHLTFELARADFALGERSALDVGYGCGLTGAGNDDVLNVRLGLLFGKP